MEHFAHWLLGLDDEESKIYETQQRERFIKGMDSDFKLELLSAIGENNRGNRAKLGIYDDAIMYMTAEQLAETYKKAFGMSEVYQ
jgi:hypothetical protein